MCVCVVCALVRAKKPLLANFKRKFSYFSFSLFRSFDLFISFILLNLRSMQFVVHGILNGTVFMARERIANAKKIKVAFCTFMHIFPCRRFYLSVSFALPFDRLLVLWLCRSVYALHPFSTLFLCIVFSVNDEVSGDYSNMQYNRK